jgi:nitrate/TMAO reductase-like tetraheme cytochrome c subunit
MRIRRVLSVAVLTAATLLIARAALAQTGSCPSCHYADPSTPARQHLTAWERSAHGRANVGCESCHGGDASSYDAPLAHRGLRPSTDRRSLVHRTSLPATCGRCHIGPFVGFQKSHHFTLLKRGDPRVPTCTTCHDAVGSQLPSARVLEAECQRCHGPRGTAPRIERAAAARVLLEAVNESRELLRAAKPFLDRMNDTPRRAELRAAYQQAEVPLVEAGQSVHEFVFDTLKERLATARHRIDALLGELANPRSGTP